MKMHLSFETGDPPLNPEILPLIGQIITRWARFENVLYFDLMAMLKRAARQRKGLYQSFAKRIDLWLELNQRLYAGNATYIAAAERIHSDATILADHRNTLIHGFWGDFAQPDPDALTLLSFEHRQHKHVMVQHNIKIEALRMLAHQIRQVHQGECTYMKARLLAGRIPKDSQSW
jgi:hypothetical protein